MEAARQLCHTEARADEDGERGCAEAAQEGLEQRTLVQARVRHGPRLRALPQAVRELGTAEGEQGERKDLERQAGDHDVDAQLVLRRRGGAAGDAAARGLQDQAEHVAAAEEERVGAGPEAAQVLAVHHDDAREAQVDGGADERGRDGQGDEVEEEVVAGGVEGVLVEQDASDVADDLADESNEHGGHVAPCLVSDSQVQVGEDVEAEDGGVQRVAA